MLARRADRPLIDPSGEAKMCLLVDSSIHILVFPWASSPPPCWPRVHTRPVVSTERFNFVPFELVRQGVANRDTTMKVGGWADFATAAVEQARSAYDQPESQQFLRECLHQLTSFMLHQVIRQFRVLVEPHVVWRYRYVSWYVCVTSDGMVVVFVQLLAMECGVQGGKKQGIVVAVAEGCFVLGEFDSSENGGDPDWWPMQR